MRQNLPVTGRNLELPKDANIQLNLENLCQVEDKLHTLLEHLRSSRLQ